jgi:hypothetical protein
LAILPQGRSYKLLLINLDIFWRPSQFCASGRGPTGPALGTALTFDVVLQFVKQRVSASNLKYIKVLVGQVLGVEGPGLQPLKP